MNVGRRLLAVTVAAGTLLGTTINAGAQSLDPIQVQPGTTAPVGMFFDEDWLNALATNLNLPADTVRSALQQMPPPAPPVGANPDDRGPVIRSEAGPQGTGGLASSGHAVFFSDSLVNALATNLNLPADTVRSALEKTPPPAPADRANPDRTSQLIGIPPDPESTSGE